MNGTAPRLATWAIAFCAGSAAACATGLHPYTTLAGRHFPSTQTAELHEGQTPNEVRAILGEPFEVMDGVEGTVWRYYERAHPRGCTSYLFGLSLGSRPEWVNEAIVTFRSDRVIAVKVHKQRDTEAAEWETPQNNQMQLTKPAPR